MQASLMTGSMPGIAASTSETWVLGSPPNSVEAPENSFEFEVTWAWISSPITISQSPVALLMSLPLLVFMRVRLRAMQKQSAPIRFRENRSQPACPPAGTNSRRCQNRLRRGADKHGPRLSQGCPDPERSYAPRPSCLWKPTTTPQAARPTVAQARRAIDWL